MMNQKNNCPICKKQYYSISKSLDICGEHEEWVITRCDRCGVMSFSEEVGICVKCANATAKMSVRDTIDD